jgi:hypothetical protein
LDRTRILLQKKRLDRSRSEKGTGSRFRSDRACVKMLKLIMERILFGFLLKPERRQDIRLIRALANRQYLVKVGTRLGTGTMFSVKYLDSGCVKIPSFFTHLRSVPWTNIQEVVSKVDFPHFFVCVFLTDNNC